MKKNKTETDRKNMYDPSHATDRDYDPASVLGDIHRNLPGRKYAGTVRTESVD